MIIHTKDILKKVNLSFLSENEEIQQVLSGEDKIKIFLFNGTKNTKEITKKLDLTPRAIRKCLTNLEKKGEVKRVKGKSINKKFRTSDYWKLIKKESIPNRVPKGQIFAHYRREHYNKSYRNHYIFFPKKIVLNEERLSAIGFFEAEGSKTKTKSVEVVNSEPNLINLFINLLEYFKIGKEDLSYRIIFNRKILNKLNKKPEEIKSKSSKFWVKKIKIPKDRIRKFNYTGPKKGNLRDNFAKQGSLNINYNSVLFRMFLFSLTKEVKNRIKEKEEIIPYLRGYLAGEAYVGKYDREIQIASKDIDHLNFIKSLLEKINIRNSISKATSTSPPRIIITNLNSFLILESMNIFKFHPEKRFNLIKKILNYKSLNQKISSKLKKKMSNSKRSIS